MWQAIQYEPKHLPEMLEMAQENYGRDNDIANHEFIYHQYFENSAGDALVNLAWDAEAEKIAGQYIVWPMRFYVEKDIACVNSLNTLTRKAYRGQGIFTGLAQRTYENAARQGYAFCYGIPNPNSYPGFIKKLGFIDLGRVPLYLRPLQPSAMVHEFLHSMPLSIAAYPFNFCFSIRPVKRMERVEIIRMTEDTIGIGRYAMGEIEG